MCQFFSSDAVFSFPPLPAIFGHDQSTWFVQGKPCFVQTFSVLLHLTGLPLWPSWKARHRSRGTWLSSMERLGRGCWCNAQAGRSRKCWKHYWKRWWWDGCVQPLGRLATLLVLVSVHVWSIKKALKALSGDLFRWLYASTWGILLWIPGVMARKLFCVSFRWFNKFEKWRIPLN